MCIACKATGWKLTNLHNRFEPDWDLCDCGIEPATTDFTIPVLNPIDTSSLTVSLATLERTQQELAQ